jgi:hypothetical protein
LHRLPALLPLLPLLLPPLLVPRKLLLRLLLLQVVTRMQYACPAFAELHHYCIRLYCLYQV